MKQSFKSLMTACLVVTVLLSVSGVLRGEILFGLPKFGTGRYYRMYYLEFSQKGRFFTATDSESTGKSAGKKINWTSDGNKTVFGVEFDYPIKPNWTGQLDRFDDQIPLFDRAVIWWGENVPAEGSWSACILTTGGKLVRINPDNSKPLETRGKTIYPSDRTTIHFDPTTIKKFYIGVKDRDDGKPNIVTVRNINLFILADQNRTLKNHMNVVEQEFYLVRFSTTSPGVISDIWPANDLFGTGVPLFRWMTPYIEYEGETVLPTETDSPVTVSKSNGADVAEYTLPFALSGNAAAVDLNVKYIFRTSEEKSMEVQLRAAGLPSGAKIGYRFYGPTTYFGAIAGATPTLSGDPVAMRTPGGKLKIYLDGTDHINLAKTKDRDAEKNHVGEAFEWVKFETASSGGELGVAISLPVGSAGLPQPEMLNYTWRPSLASGGDEAIGPFNLSDLELLEEIDCGDPNDPHTFYDCTNDPVVDVLRKKYGDKLEFGKRNNEYGFLSFSTNPEKFAVPLQTIDGQRCRAIPDEIGSYFRYDLNTKLKPRTPYLVVVEHAFDKVRRGEFHTIVLDKKSNKLVRCIRFLFGALEAEPGPGGGFKKEYVLCNIKRMNFFGWRKNRKHSLVFSNIVKSGPWIKTPGPAIKSIKIYRVKTMPELPDISTLSPAAEHQRSLTVWTEFCYEGADPFYLCQYPRLVGYNAIMSHARQSPQFFGQSSRYNWEGEFHDWTHPGTLAGNEMLYKAAREYGLFVNTYLGFLLKWGFEGLDEDSFAVPNMYHCVAIPLKPTRKELDHIAGALRNVMPKLAKFRSFRDVVVKFNIPFSKRDIDDFNAATGAKITPSLSSIKNLQSLLNGGPELVRKWQQWACAERFKFLQWLLAELKKYRPDLFITLNRYWEQDESSEFLANNSIFGRNFRVSRKQFASGGVNDFIDFQRFLGIDPARFAGNPDFSFELEACARLNSTRFPPIPGGDEIPDYYDTEWFNQLRDCFKKGGLGITFNQRYEFSVPLLRYMCAFVFPKTEFRKQLIQAFVFANPRNITIGSYNQPWGARLADFREFAVPYRLLPFTEPEPYGGKMSDTASQAVIKKYGDRYGLANNGGESTVAELELPDGNTSVTDLSSGVPQKLKTLKNKDGKLSVKIAMLPWSLKTLEIK